MTVKHKDPRNAQTRSFFVLVVFFVSWCFLVPPISAPAQRPIPDAEMLELGPDCHALVLDPSDGRLLALSDEQRPFSETVPAQSLAQLVTAYAAASDPDFDIAVKFDCAGRCLDSTTGHGPVDLESALAVHCDRYFRHIAPAVGLAGFREAAIDLGLGPSPTIDYVNGVSVIPVAITRTALPELLSIGAGMALTPARAAAVVAILARDDKRDARALGVVRGAFRRSQPSGISGLTAIGSSGPCWFIGYAPTDAPVVAVVVVDSTADGATARGIALLKQWKTRHESSRKEDTNSHE